MESSSLDELGQILATKTSRRGAMKAVAGGAGGIGSSFSPDRPVPPSVGMAADAVRDAERRLTAAVDPHQVPLPTVRLSVGVVEPGVAP